MISGPAYTVKLARKLRREMSLPEVMLWQELRKRPGGHKFRRQHPAGPFVLDFYCAKVRLDAEVDGIAHDSPAASARDAKRSAFLRRKGIATTRITAKLILADLDAVVRRLIVICDERLEDMTNAPLNQPAAGPPPRFGEER